MSSPIARCTKTQCKLITQIAKQATFYSTTSLGPKADNQVSSTGQKASSENNPTHSSGQKNLSVNSTEKLSSSDKPKVSPRMAEFQKKLRQKTPIGKLDEIEGKHPYQEKEPLVPWPNNTNPNTGEVGGPAGPEPTRFGDWERKGRVTDF